MGVKEVVTTKSLLLLIILLGFRLSVAQDTFSTKPESNLHDSARIRRIAPVKAFIGGLADNTQISNGYLWNPATLAFARKTEISFIGTPIISQLQDSRGPTTLRRAGGVSATVSATQLGISNQAIGGLAATVWFDEWANPITDLSTSLASAQTQTGDSGQHVRRGVAISYGLPLNNITLNPNQGRWGVGTTVRFFQSETIPRLVSKVGSVERTQRMALDLGVQYSRLDFLRIGRPISFGLAVMEIGNLPEREQISRQAPIIRLGSIYHLTDQTLLSVDWDAVQDSQRHFHFGIEQWLFRLSDSRPENTRGYFAIRAGLTVPPTSPTGVSSKSNQSLADYPYQFGATLQSGDIQPASARITANLRLDYTYTRLGLAAKSTAITPAAPHEPAASSGHWLTATISWGSKSSSASSELGTDAPAYTSASEPERDLTLRSPLAYDSRLTASTSNFSPNNDEQTDFVTFTFGDLDVGSQHTTVGQRKLVLEIRDRHQRIVQKFQTFQSTADGHQAVWDGTNLAQNTVTDGQYMATLVQVVPSEERKIHSQTRITVDTIAPTFEISAEPIIFVADALAVDGSPVHRPTIHFTKTAILSKKEKVDMDTFASIAHWQITILADGQRVLDQLRGYGSPPNPFLWNEQTNSLNQLRTKPETGAEIDEPHTSIISAGKDSIYHCVVTLCDLAGNCATQTTPLSVIDLRQLSGRQDQRGLVLSLPGIMFDTDSYQIKTGTYDRELAEIAQAINAYPEAEVIIEGHTDDIGDADYNLELSERRARSVRDYLIEQFEIDPDRLLALGRGELAPVTTNDSEESRQKNRRVDIVLLTKDGPIRSNELDTQELLIDKDQLLPGEYYTLLVGSFQDLQNAQNLMLQLKNLNLFIPIRVSAVTTDGSSQVWHRVTVGRFYHKEAATSIIQTLIPILNTKPLLILSRSDD